MGWVVKNFYRGFLLFSLALTGAAVLTGCGKDGADASMEYSVVLEGAGGKSSAEMLRHLTHQVLRIEGREGIRELKWSPRTHQRVEFEVGDELVFAAFDGAGTLTVEGRARVGGEKRISIPLREVLYFRNEANRPNCPAATDGFPGC
jgi:hypothetical protein